MSIGQNRDVGDLVPRALRQAVARGWRGLTIVAGSDDGRPVALVRAADPETAGVLADERLLVGVSGPAPRTHWLVFRLAHDRSDGPRHELRLALDLRLAGVRRLARGLAAADAVAIIELSHSDGCRMRRRHIPIAPAADLLRGASAHAGEWHASDPGGGLASAVRWGVDADPSLPRLLAGARFGDPPVLAVPAGGAAPRMTAGALARMVRSELPDQARHLAQVRTMGRFTIAEVALGDHPVVTALRAAVLDDRPVA